MRYPIDALCQCGDTYASHVGGGCDEIGCSCLEFEPTGQFSPTPSRASSAEDVEIEAADDREARRTGGTFAKHYLGGFDLPGGESTSARLRQVQADLAASQADLTRAERERDEALLGRRNALHCFDGLSAKYDLLRAELAAGNRFTAGVVDEVNRLERERDLARAELATASKEVRLLRARLQTPSKGAPMDNDNQPDGGTDG